MSGSHQTRVRRQFDRQFTHYLASSAMADRQIIDAILAAAPVRPGERVLDVACGAGFLLQAYRDAGADVFGVDLSEAMLREAAKTLGPTVPPDHLIPGNAARLPFDRESFDLVTCKLAMHYFPDPDRSLLEMVRACRKSGSIALIDRVASDDPELCSAQNWLEKLRTPNKVRVYAERELSEMLTRAGTTIVRRDLLIQLMDFEEWMAAAGAQDRTEIVRQILIGPNGEDLAGLAPREEAGRLVIHHRTLILVAKPAAA